MARENWRQYFDFSPIDGNRMNGRCRLCHRNYKDKNGIFSNFLKHLRRMHPLDYNQILENDHECFTEDTNLTDRIQCETDVTKTKYKENRVVASITKNLIIRCNFPLNLVEKPAFRDFMKECNFKCPSISSKRIKYDIIPSFSNVVMKRIQDALNSTQHVTLTVDTWSDRRCRSYLGITCHFIDQKMIPQAFLIDFLRFKYPHTSENIQLLTEEVLERLDIKQKVFRIVTDNASSMIKAYKFGFTSEDDNNENGHQNRLISDIDQSDDAFISKFSLNKISSAIQLIYANIDV